MNKFNTEQELFWAGEFGDKYIDRNNDFSLIESNFNLFSEILFSAKSIKNLIELGANIGLNLVAIKRLLPDLDLSGVELNQKAFEQLRNIKEVNAYNESILNFSTKFKYDLVLTKTVLIHIAPNKLKAVYDLIYKLSNKYICIVEYYNPKPVILDYRGYSNKLFKRDFAGEFLDRFQDCVLVDYGFTYHRDKKFSALDDLNWFLIEKIKQNETNL